MKKEELQKWGKWQMIFGIIFLDAVITTEIFSEPKIIFTVSMILFSCLTIGQGFYIYNQEPRLK